MNTSLLDFVVVNIQTKQPVAAFMLPGDAQRFIASRSHPERYEVVDAIKEAEKIAA